jgi:mono/diheme cytochrome c family protein
VRLASVALVVLVAATAHAAKDACRKACADTARACAAQGRRSTLHLIDTCGNVVGCFRTVRRWAHQAVGDCRTIERRACRPCCAGTSRNGCRWTQGAALPEEAIDPLERGDAPFGRHVLLEGDYMTCGVPYKLWQVDAFKPFIAGGFGGTADAPRIADRAEPSADLPYFLNAFTAPDGAQVVNANCLMCHGGLFDGQLVVGLGNATGDFTHGAGGVGADVPLTDEFLDALGLDATEKDQLRRIAARAAVLAEPTSMRTVGMNPAEMVAIILMLHHDRDTLAWSDLPLIPFVMKDHAGAPIADPRMTSDPPPWWRARKKHALFYNGMARGDHRGTMALATSVCVDDVPRARVVDDAFRDIQAFVESVEAPTYPRAIDRKLAARGRRVFLESCAGCHGTYHEYEPAETYPNLLLPLATVGTDPVVAEAGVVHAPELVAWYNLSFYGQVTRMEPNDPFPGYMPPPLDGIWATAPYLHNGSVPTIELVLNSGARPTYWKRVDLDSTHFDEDALGWPFEATAPPAELPVAEQPFVYDTTQWSQSNAGHPFGDHLTSRERRAVLEYLKTL